MGRSPKAMKIADEPAALPIPYNAAEVCALSLCGRRRTLRRGGG